MQDIATDLGVTESRVSQMRAEALVLLRAGLESALDTESAPVEKPKGRAAKRTADYMTAVAAASNSKIRISAATPAVAARFAVTDCGPDGEILATHLIHREPPPTHTLRHPNSNPPN